MLLYIVLVLGVWKGVMGNGDLCNMPVDQVCTLPHDLGYPETEEEKIYQCPLVRQWNDCRKDYVNKCGYVDGLTKDRIQRVTDLYDELCDSLPRPVVAIAIDDGACQERADRACPSHRIWPDTFPANIEELRNGCQKVHIVTQCINDTLKECKSGDVGVHENYYSYNYERDENPQRLTFDQRLMYIATQVCDEDSEFHRSNIRYLPCLKSAFEAHVRQNLCWDYSEKALDFLSNRIEGKARMASGSEDRVREVRHEIWKCLRVVFDLNCVINELSKACDSGVKQPILEVVEKLEIIDDQCPMSTRMDVIEILDAVKLVSRQEIHVEGLIRVNSFF